MPALSIWINRIISTEINYHNTKRSATKVNKTNYITFRNFGSSK